MVELRVGSVFIESGYDLLELVWWLVVAERERVSFEDLDAFRPGLLVLEGRDRVVGDHLEEVVGQVG